MGRRGAIFGLTVFLMIAAQCFALCSVMPCSIPQKASCHHDGPEKGPCGHEAFVTEGASKPDVTPVVIAITFAPDSSLLLIADFVTIAPDLAAPELPSNSILRI